MAAGMVLLICVFFAPITLLADSISRIQAEGLGAIVAGDRAAAFDEAKRAALRQAVEEGVGVLLSAHTRVENFMAIEDNIYTATAGYVRSYEIVEQGDRDRNTYFVKVDATVELGALQKRLDSIDILLEQAGNPYILCLAPQGEAENVELALLMRSALAEVSDQMNLMVTGEGVMGYSAADYRRHGVENGADIVVIAAATIQLRTGGSLPFSTTSLGDLGLFSASAHITGEALWSDSGEVFSSHGVTVRAAASSEEGARLKALKGGVGRLSGLLVADLVENWRQKAFSHRLVRVVIDLADADLQRVEQLLVEAMGAAHPLHRRSVIDGVAVYDVKGSKSGFELARQLVGRGMDPFQLTIRQTTANTLKLRIRGEL